MVFGVGFSEYCGLAAGCCAETVEASSSRARAKRAAPRGMEAPVKIVSSREGPPPPGFPDLRILKDFQGNENGSAHFDYRLSRRLWRVISGGHLKVAATRARY